MPALNTHDGAWRRLLAWSVNGLQALDRYRNGWRQLGHAGVFLLLMLAATRLMEPLKPLDWRLLETLDAGAPRWPGRVSVIDLGWDMDPAGLPRFRQDLAEAITALARLKAAPALLVLDVSINTVPIGLDELRASLDRLRDAHPQTAIIQAASLDRFPFGASRETGLLQQGRQALHGMSGASYGHASFGYDAGGRKAWYARCEAIPTAPDDPPLVAIPALVAAALDVQRPDDTPQCEADPQRQALPVIFTPGAAQAVRGHLWCLQRGVGLQPMVEADSCPATAAAAAPEANLATAETLAGQVLIIGNLAHDRVGPWAGPALLAWAIGDASGRTDAEHPLLADDPRLALLAMAVFSAATLGLVGLLRRPVATRAAPALTAIGGALLALLLLAGTVLALRHGLHVAFFQLSYVCLGIVLSALLAWHAMAQTLRRQALYTSVSDAPDDAEPEYDLFISYSRSPVANIERVQRELVEPLRQLRTAGGEPLRVFFDKASIRVGTSWYLALAQGIECSRCFIAVYSNDYFRKNFCRFELTKAIVREISTQGQQAQRPFRVLPFQVDPQALPPAEFGHVQFDPYDPATTPADRLKAIRAALRELGVETYLDTGRDEKASNPSAVSAPLTSSSSSPSS